MSHGRGPEGGKENHATSRARAPRRAPRPLEPPTCSRAKSQ
ncbi:Hypothetical protein AA314_00794 [Archangium gephyra]|uniref:Uncharacterized protein n=1 Tax=Archangium gephyra TaxID=48 RepID=A0AAC8Q1D6_9BACT|nr:Hypothetical protein AA314_00794 [Archangium gephyra]